MRERLYQILVNRVPGIRERFQQKRQTRTGKWRVLSLFYLLLLNFRYYCLGQKTVGQSLRYPCYEEKKLLYRESESVAAFQKTPGELARELSRFDVISFDIFDTLLFRPFSEPADLFYLVGIRLSCPGFRKIRQTAEEEARKKKQIRTGSREVTLQEIWAVVEEQTGISREKGMEAEWETERSCCFANPYMQEVVNRLREKNKTIIAVSDMYLGENRLKELLKNCGYDGFQNIYVSCDYGVSKSSGKLYGCVAERGEIIHVGDHETADIQRAKEQALAAFFYPNINRKGNLYRCTDMSFLTGSLYRGMVNAHLYSGNAVYSREYEYGFVYGGLFTVGYCRFIHRYAKSHGIDKLLFLARDGAVLLEGYRMLYPEKKQMTEYVYWSRLAGLKVTAQFFRYEYFQRFLYHKVNQQYTLRQILQGMELEDLIRPLCEAVKLPPDTELTNRNVEKVRNYLTDNWKVVLEHYQEQRTGAEQYFRKVFDGCKKVAAVDIGWAGSGAQMLDCAVNRMWNLECSVTGIVAGTNTGNSQEPDRTEPDMMEGKLVSYLYSSQENRDIWKLHDGARGHNLYWEMLLSASHGSLKGFYLDEEGGYELRFKKVHGDVSKMEEIQRGILDFVKLFLETEARIGYPIFVSGRDAYGPMISVLSEKNRKFRKKLTDLTDEIHV